MNPAISYLFVFLFISIISSVLGLACNYIQFGADHTMCKYKEKACKAKVLELSQTDADNAVKAHNEKRQLIASGKQKGQPIASNMKQLVWSKELATIAQRWADQCIFDHDLNRKTKNYAYVGQNGFTYRTTSTNINFNITKAVNAWYHQVISPGFSSKSISPYKFNPAAGHYTQLQFVLYSCKELPGNVHLAYVAEELVVWANTDAIGCGFSVFKGADDIWHKLIICNYGPGTLMEEITAINEKTAASRIKRDGMRNYVICRFTFTAYKQCEQNHTLLSLRNNQQFRSIDKGRRTGLKEMSSNRKM
uniref:Cysteine-rich venom protein n=1 Tax=Strigamia maritima TaxID=126957 RepID=T1IN52_STRMM